MTHAGEPTTSNTQYPAEHEKAPPLTRPGLGVLVDPERMAAARKSAMLERIELANLSQALDLIKLATANGIKTTYSDAELVEHPGLVANALRARLQNARVATRKPGLRIGVSRDEIAKLESGGRKRPRITTLRKIIDTLNCARTERGKPPLDIEDLQVDGEGLIPEDRDEISAHRRVPGGIQ